MHHIQGEYNEAIVYASTLEEKARLQIETLLNQPFSAGSRVRVMPDVHAGVGCTIGTTMTITDKVVPNLVGVDIGCGIETVKLRQKHIELEQLDKVIRRTIPAGFRIRNAPHEYSYELDLLKLRCVDAVNLKRASFSIGTLGGGNHFIEVDRDEEDSLYLTVHSGSRHLGVEVAGYYQNAGYAALNGTDVASMVEYSGQLHRAGELSKKEIEKALGRRKREVNTDIPRDLAYLEGKLFEDYIHDMKLVQAFAALNRKAMVREILKGMKLDVEEQFTTVHNYIDTDAMILRKGAVSAKAGERLLIPINMRDGSLICSGKGNQEWNQSAPHGAGRLMSRTKAKSSFTVSQFEKEMEGIYTTSVGRDTLDEAPMVYKDMDEILENIGPTADVLKVIKPIYNFKAGQA